jgi:hypothetical protein
VGSENQLKVTPERCCYRTSWISRQRFDAAKSPAMLSPAQSGELANVNEDVLASDGAVSCWKQTLIKLKPRTSKKD